MLSPMNWIVAAAVLLTAMPVLGGTTRIDVQCEFTGALESDGIALRGASPESGLAAPSDSPGFLPVLEVGDAVASLSGLNVHRRSDANVLGGVFRENSQVHISAVDWSSIRLLFEPTIGSATDATSFAMGAARSSRISSYGISTIYGDVSALDDASIRLGETVLHGDLLVSLFANAHVRNAEITGSVFCRDGADVICRQTTTSGSSGCASSTCGPPTAETTGRSPSAAHVPVSSELRFERPARR